ncbi:MAG: Hsp20/alpha crystallin family protein [Chloroflexi bacterium]|nr:Hsp20/alpha crystallin family protein [Chloroflexota bacterium]
MSNLTRWNPHNEMEQFFRPFEELMNDLWQNRWPAFNSETARPMLRPAMDIVEQDNEIVVRLDLPGLSAEDVQVELEDNVLTVSGEMGDTIEQEGERYHYRERRFGAFQRNVRLPNTVDAEHVEASFDNGVLNISLPKLPEAQPKQIEVKTGKKN